jgi:hypothetical protein
MRFPWWAEAGGKVVELAGIGTRTLIAATFGIDQVEETCHVHDLLGALGRRARTCFVPATWRPSH